MRSSWLYLARRSERHGAPVLIWPVHRPTARSAMNVSSVSPERCDVITPQPAPLAMLTASMASETEPIWLTLSSSALHAFSSMAFCTRVGLVTSEVVADDLARVPSPDLALRSSLYQSQSSWSKGSSMVTIGKSLAARVELHQRLAADLGLRASLMPRSYLKSRSYTSLLVLELGRRHVHADLALLPS